MIERFDLVFSYWIFFWFCLYLFHPILKYSPKFALIIAFIINIICLLLLIYNKLPLSYILMYIIVNFLIKVIPLYILRKEPVVINSIYFTFLVIFVYMVYFIVYAGGIQEAIKLAENMINAFYSGKGKMPLTNLLL